jgi:beta-fructofuranosidase
VNQIFYRPQRAAVGDVIPFYTDGEFKLFYIHLWRDPGTPVGALDWHLVGTRDFIHYQEYGSCNIPGGTGAVSEVDGMYHLFYCIFQEGGLRQIVCHATSSDLLHWEKHPEENFEPDLEYYGPNDWRDPFVFWNDAAGEYWMLLAARTRSPYSRGGCVGLCVSNDLKHWQARPPFYAPDLYLSAAECPDLFQIGDWWYLLYSTYNDRFVTHYRMSRTVDGPWIAPAEDTFDGRAFYAAKTGSDGEKRFLFGWNPTRTDNAYNWNPPGYAGKDFNTWDWGGNLVVHEIVQATDGTLQVRLPDRVATHFQHEQRVVLRPVLGDWSQSDDRYRAVSPFGFACAMGGSLPTCCLVSVRFRFKPDTRRLGIILRATEKLDKGYHIQLEPDRSRVVFKTYVFPDEHGGKILPYEVELERPLALQPNQDYSLKLVIDETICVMYINDQVAMSARMYDLQTGALALFVADGEASFDDILVKTS